jgi:hypothetical protein
MIRKVTVIDTTVDVVNLNENDLSLLQDNVTTVDTSLNVETDKVEQYIFTSEDLLFNYDNDYRNYRVDTTGPIQDEEVTKLIFDIEKDIDNISDIYSGIFTFKYCFVRNAIKGSTDFNLFIESLSPDRTEIRAYSVYDTEETLVQSITAVKNELQNQTLLPKLQVNFGNDDRFKVINVGTQKVDTKTYVVFKLYEPLPSTFENSDVFTFQENISDDISYQVEVELLEEPIQYAFIKGPNFNIDNETIKISNPTDYTSTLDLKVDTEQIAYKSIVESSKQDYNVNVDYSDFSNFIHFSSAVEKLKNFRFKLNKLKFLEIEKQKVNNLQPILLRNNRIEFLDKEITSILKTFDHYDNFLYFENTELSWPKVDNNYPYVNQDTDTQDSIEFFNNLLSLASIYDQNNPDNLINSVPEYIRDDETNTPYLLFINMIGEHFDTLWLYANSVSERYNGDNRLNVGISRDLVADALRGFGIKLYDSKVSFSNLFAGFTGEFYNTGSEHIQTFISASNIPTSVDSYQKQIYKRLYHNLPLLVKSKGTERGIRGLINIFGIPEEVLQIRFYGGQDTTVLPVYNTSFETTSSLDKIRLDNTGSTLTGNVLSSYTKISKDDKKYTQDLHTLEIGFSPTQNVDNYIKDFIPPTFSIDEYIGDPRLRYSKVYPELDKFNEDLIKSNIQNRYDLYDFIRLLKFFDNTLFKMIKDFVPARTNLTTGIIIEPTLLEKNKTNQVEPKWSKQDKTNAQSKLDYTGEEYSSNFIFDQSLEIGDIEGRDGGSFKEGSIVGTYDEFVFIGEYDTSFKYRIKLPRGGYGSKRSRDEAKYTGEFAGKITGIISGSITDDGDSGRLCYVDTGYVVEGYVECISTLPCYVDTGYVIEGYVDCGIANGGGGGGSSYNYFIFEAEPSFILVTDRELNPISKRKDINKVHNNFKRTNLKVSSFTTDNFEVDTTPPVPTPTSTPIPLTPTPTPTSGFINPTPTPTSPVSNEFIFYQNGNSFQVPPIPFNSAQEACDSTGNRIAEVYTTSSQLNIGTVLYTEPTRINLLPSGSYLISSSNSYVDIFPNGVVNIIDTCVVTPPPTPTAPPPTYTYGVYGTNETTFDGFGSDIDACNGTGEVSFNLYASTTPLQEGTILYTNQTLTSPLTGIVDQWYAYIDGNLNRNSFRVNKQTGEVTLYELCP